ncbi:faciogenital dysplasia protein [Anaeramoeba flamelloides]|uniref:Faciogenital dysplasia protein n=1 Tax=Anaeramoeba flamelloides TaxID=1746091 RepID=A0AAV7Y0W5_9EUKA|nr:faciogenital dysplasia protein [Anaeramoeba flamelloides]
MQRDWDKIQQAQYVPWMNRHLATRNLKVNNFQQDLSNGILIINLLEIITGDSVGRFNKNPRIAIQKRDNFDLVFTFMKKKGTHVIGCSTQDIIRGETKVLLSLVWNIIRMAEKIKGQGLHKEKTVLSIQTKTKNEKLRNTRSTLFNKWEQRVKEQTKNASTIITKRENNFTKTNSGSNIVIHRTKRFDANKPKTNINNKTRQKLFNQNFEPKKIENQLKTKPKDQKIEEKDKPSNLSIKKMKEKEIETEKEIKPEQRPKGKLKTEKETKHKIEKVINTEQKKIKNEREQNKDNKTENLPLQKKKKQIEKETKKKNMKEEKESMEPIEQAPKIKNKKVIETEKNHEKNKAKITKKLTKQLPKIDNKIIKTENDLEKENDSGKSTEQITEKIENKNIEKEKALKKNIAKISKIEPEKQTPKIDNKIIKTENDLEKENDSEKSTKQIEKKIQKKNIEKNIVKNTKNQLEKSPVLKVEKGKGTRTKNEPKKILQKTKETQKTKKSKKTKKKKKLTKKQERRLKNRRKKIVEEIYSSEVTYVTSLKTMIEVYLNPMKEHVNPIQIRSIFSQIDSIINFNELLLNEIKPRCTNWNEKSLIGDIFLKLVSFLKIYTNYINNYNSAIQTLAQLTTKKRDLAKLLEKQSLLPDVKGLKLTFFLIMPIQRIPRYVMLLQDLVKHTHKKHPDYGNLKESLTKVQEIAMYCNEKKREADQMAETFKIQSKISGLSDIVIPSRRFLREGTAFIKLKNSKKIMKCYLHLFNDLLIISKKAKKLKLLNQIELDLETYILDALEYSIEIDDQNNNDSDDDESKNNNNTNQEEPTKLFGFTIRDWTLFEDDEEFSIGTTFYFDSKIEKLEWITSFDRLKNKRMEVFKTRTIKEINNPELCSQNREIDFLKEKKWSMEKFHQKSKKGGYLMKHSPTKIHDIKPSFLILLKENLLIFKYQNDEQETPISNLSKTIFIGTCSVVFNPNYKNGLEILTPNRIYYFSSKKLEHTLKWISVLRKQIYRLLRSRLEEEKKLRGIYETSDDENDDLEGNNNESKRKEGELTRQRSKKISLRKLSINSPNPLREKYKNLFEDNEMGEETFKRGYIYKHSGNFLKEWKKRYVVLHANHLLFYKNEKDQDNITEIIDLTFCKYEIRVNNKFILEKKFAFDLVTSNRVYILKCKTRNQLFKWMEAIQNRIKSIEDLENQNEQEESTISSNSEGGEDEENVMGGKKVEVERKGEKKKGEKVNEKRKEKKKSEMRNEKKEVKKKGGKGDEKREVKKSVKGDEKKKEGKKRGEKRNEKKKEREGKENGKEKKGDKGKKK